MKIMIIKQVRYSTW